MYTVETEEGKVIGKFFATEQDAIDYVMNIYHAFARVRKYGFTQFDGYRGERWTVVNFRLGPGSQYAVDRTFYIGKEDERVA